jgi:hypothetical protein
LAKKAEENGEKGCRGGDTEEWERKKSWWLFYID